MQYDREADAIYIRFSEADVEGSEELRAGITGDFDASGRLVALEILGVSKVLSGFDPKTVSLQVAAE